MSDLRPYYNPDNFDAGYSVIYKPGVGLVNPNTGTAITSSIQPVTPSHYNASSIGIKAMGIHKDSFEKDYFNDLEFSEYFEFNNLNALLKNLMWNFFKNYVKMLLLQPLEITRLVLQVGTFEFKKPKSDNGTRLMDLESTLTPSASLVPSLVSEDESDTEVNYFQSANEKSPTKQTMTGSGTLSKKEKRKHKIQPISKHTIDIMAAIVQKDGPNALFRGLNAQFIHQTLSHTIEAWITGFLSPFLKIPDPFFLDLTHSTEPLRSLCLSVSACVLTGIVLMPLDLVKVRLMVTQFTKPYDEETDEPRQSTRSIRESMRNYPKDLILKPPATISFLTVLHQFATSIFRKSAPYLLFIRFNVDQYSSPKLYTFSNLLLSIMEFFIKLPVENLLRKEQVRFLLKPKSTQEDPLRVVTIDNPDRDLIVEFNDGWKQESNTHIKTLWQKFLHLGLFNGWRVGVLNIIGFWGYKIVQSGASVQEEKL